jgi:DNA polymerase-3 subunit delta'
MLCSAAEDERPCHICPHCVKIRRGIHPDVIVVSRQRDDRGGLKRELAVSQIREAITDASVAPNDASMRVIVIEEADKMRREAQNALLKTLEEPPAHLAIALITDLPGDLLPTVRSRCRILDSGESPPKVSEGAAELAKSYFSAAVFGASRLAEFSFELEKAERSELSAFLSETRRLASSYLREALETGHSRLPERALTGILAAISECEKYMVHNVGAVHITALICAVDLRPERV